MLSQQEVADRAGTSLFTIQRIERGEGNVRPKTGRALAEALGVGIEDLLPKAQAPLPFEESETSQAERRSAEDQAWEALATLFADLGADPRETEKLKAVRGTVREELPDVGEQLFRKLFWSEALFHLQISGGLLSAEEVSSPERHAVSKALHEEIQMLEGVADIEHWQSEQ